MKDLELPKTDWGTTRIYSDSNPEKPRIFIYTSGPRGGFHGNNYLTPLEALGVAEYLKAWALEVLKENKA